MSNGLIQLRTYTRLGAANLARVAGYKIGLKTRYHPVQRLSATIAEPAFFRTSERQRTLSESKLERCHPRFGRQLNLTNDPDWFANPFSNAPQPSKHRRWKIPDFGAGDIKISELSRLDWVLVRAGAAAQGDLVRSA